MDLYGIKLSEKQIDNILKEIRKNSIKYLYLRDCAIEDKELIYISEAIKRNKSIELFDIAFNKITDFGIENLAKALKFNKSLTYLRFSNFGTTWKSLKAIDELLDINTILLQIKFMNHLTDIDYEYKESIEEKLERNKEIDKTVKEIAHMILTSSSMILGGHYVPKDIRRLLAKYVLDIRASWLFQ